MIYRRAALPLALTLLLAGCGGTGPTPTPPTEQPPTETPPIVQPPVEQPPQEGAPVINVFSTNPATISVGESTTLSWDVTNAEIIRLEPDPGQGDLSSQTSVTVTPTTTTTYTLEAVSLNGLNDTASVTVTVEGSSQPPPSDVPYYSEWEVAFTADSGVSFVHSLNITDPLSDEFVENGGSGLQRLCIGESSNPCDEESDFAGGFGFIGNLQLDDGTAPLSLSITTLYNLNDEPELKIFSIEELASSTNSQGQQVLEGDAIWLYTANTSDEGTTGTITAVNVGLPDLLEPIDSFSLEQAAIEHREHLTR